MTTRKEQKKLEARYHANTEGLLSIDSVSRIIRKSWSRVRELTITGCLQAVKDGPAGSRTRVWITLQSVISYIDSWED